ncbi:MAG TPA: HAMP domain-containing sensor histidine kinase [Actinoplanes sp.]|nr:HAMP domain-containing sensor histidine kinase [Actinoplanes sp.]
MEAEAGPRPGVPIQARLRAVPLATKLVGAILALVFAALSLISVASTYFLQSYLISRVDDQLRDYVAALADPSSLPRLDRSTPEGVVPPTNYYISLTSIDGVGRAVYDDRNIDVDALPPLVRGVDAVNARLGKPFTVRSVGGHTDWRMLMTQGSNGSVLHVGVNLSDVENAVGRLVWLDFLVGAAVLVTLAAVGAALIRKSLHPLVQIERTAAAIAAGDLTRRVPDPEPHCVEARTELGRLSRAINAMLAQIEAAFTARAQSEAAARAAEVSARDAAEAARVSEARAVRSELKMRQFVADASHELRTPLTTIRGFAELYRQGAVTSPEDTAALVRRIEDEAHRMGLLVEDLLLLARLDRERPLTYAPVELPVLAMDAVQAAKATAPQRTIELEVLDAPEDLIAYGDDARLRQVIGNLMTNALVHTPPEASVTLRLRAETGNVAVVEIADTGPGLSPEQAERVFERFFRADEARTRHTERAATGTGLGLAIVAAIVRAHHGSVEVLDTPGGGATFRVKLPLVPAD